ncbi:MAG: DNA-3-methyladenine glycosylase I, partial [Sphingobacteriales bacterium]
MSKKKIQKQTPKSPKGDLKPIPVKYAGPNDGKVRCGWCLGDPIYVAYHDVEWGTPVHDDKV